VFKLPSDYSFVRGILMLKPGLSSHGKKFQNGIVVDDLTLHNTQL
jgi:hypothetical protein